MLSCSIFRAGRAVVITAILCVITKLAYFRQSTLLKRKFVSFG
jgi:hypothetical protein